jgi:peptidoglycan/xylan/chitin deacetylase (PgdA/CDA1 family)
MNLLIVNFHYYSTKKFESGIYPVSPENFSRQITEISKSYKFVSQRELADWIISGAHPEGNYCLITFDDGLKEQMDVFEWFLANQIPAVFYVPVKPIIEKKVLDVHKFHHVRSKISDAILLEKLMHQFDIDFTEENAVDAKRQYRYDSSISQQLKFILNFMISERQKQELTDEYFEKLFGKEDFFSEQFYMSENDIQKIAKHDMLGNHGYAHLPLATLSLEDANWDIAKSTTYLTNLTQKEVISISYPFGSTAAVNSTIADIAKSNSYVFGLTMWRGMNKDFDNPLLLKRIDTNDAPGGKSESKEFHLIEDVKN